MTANSYHIVSPPPRILLGPGPSNVHPRVLQAMAASIVGHLDPYFQTVMDETMSLLRDLFRSDADILPDREAGILQVRVHGRSNPRSNRAIQYLLSHLNDAAMNYPGTNLRLIYTHVAACPE